MLYNLLLIHLKLFLKTAIQKKVAETGDLIGNKIADKITMSQKLHHKIIQKKKKNIEHDRKIHRERYISPEQKWKIIDDLRLI